MDLFHSLASGQLVSTNLGKENLKVFRGQMKGHIGLVNVNYPLRSPNNLRHRSTITAPSGFNIRVFLPLIKSIDDGLNELDQDCKNLDYVEVGQLFFYL